MFESNKGILDLRLSLSDRLNNNKETRSRMFKNGLFLSIYYDENKSWRFLLIKMLFNFSGIAGNHTIIGNGTNNHAPGCHNATSANADSGTNRHV